MSQEIETVIFGKLAVTCSDFSIYIGRLSVVMIYHICAFVKRI